MRSQSPHAKSDSDPFLFPVLSGRNDDADYKEHGALTCSAGGQSLSGWRARVRTCMHVCVRVCVVHISDRSSPPSRRCSTALLGTSYYNYLASFPLSQDP